jgi:hypothetical protein
MLRYFSDIGFKVKFPICEKREISGGHYYLNLELYRILGS